MEKINSRLNYLDNIKWITVLIVIFYHVIYLFNNSGVVSNIGVKGIPILDTFLIFVNPWFMCLMFIVSGISSRYSLEKRTSKEFIKDRFKRILVPSLLGIFIYCWINGYITGQYADMFAGNGDKIPNFVKYIVYSLVGMGPLWYCHVLFVGSLLIVLIRKLDKKDKISNVCKKVNIPILFLLVILVWLSSKVLNVPVIEVYKFGIYLLMMLLGYYVFYNKDLIKKLEKICTPMLIISVIVGLVYTYFTYGEKYTSKEILTSLFTNVYLWLMIISLFGFSSKFLNFKNKFSTYMTKNNFNFYILHYTIEVALAYLITTYLNLPIIVVYLLVLFGTLISLPIIVEIIKRIPIVRYMILGISKRKN